MCRCACDQSESRGLGNKGDYVCGEVLFVEASEENAKYLWSHFVKLPHGKRPKWSWTS